MCSEFRHKDANMCLDPTNPQGSSLQVTPFKEAAVANVLSAVSKLESSAVVYLLPPLQDRDKDNWELEWSKRSRKQRGAMYHVLYLFSSVHLFAGREFFERASHSPVPTNEMETEKDRGKMS